MELKWSVDRVMVAASQLSFFSPPTSKYPLLSYSFFLSSSKFSTGNHPHFKVIIPHQIGIRAFGFQLVLYGWGSMTYIYVRWESSEDHPMSFEDYQVMLRRFDETNAWLELEHVGEELITFEARDEHRLSVDITMWSIYDTKFELLTHRLYKFEVQKPKRKYWKFYDYFCGEIIGWVEECS